MWTDTNASDRFGDVDQIRTDETGFTSCGLAFRFDDHGGTVGQYFCDTGHDFCRVVTKTYDGICTVHCRMVQQKLIGVFAGLLAQVCVSRAKTIKPGPRIPLNARTF